MSVTYGPSQLLKATKATFLKNFKAQMSMVELLAFIENSEHDNEVYPWLGQAPQMAELTDEVQFTPLSDTSYSITNTVYSAGLVFKRTDIADNKTGSILMRVRQLAEVASQHPNQLLTSLITSGTSSSCYDGVSFFNDSHPARGAEGGTQDNLLAGTGITTSQFATDFAAAKAAMLNFKAENGEPFHGDGGDLGYYVMIPPALEKPAREALQAQIISQTSNVQAGAANILVNPRLTGTDANDWYLFALAPTRKPFIHQNREALEFTAQDSVDNDVSFSRELYRYKVRARYAQGYAYWQCGIKTVNS